MLQSPFENNWRRKQEIAGRPVADKIYRSLFGKSTQIERSEKEDDFILDKNFAIDVKIILPSDQILLGQEKFLSHEYAKFNSVTVEYFQNPNTQEPGDWFKLAAQFYFVGYLTENKTAFSPWVLLDWMQVVLKTSEGFIDWKEQGNTKSHAMASFKHINMTKIPQDCIISCSWITSPKNSINTTPQIDWGY